MRRRTALLASCLTAVVVASTVVLPAFGAPSALTIARNALKTAKSADARSKVALATARKPGPAGAQGTQGTQGAKGDPGSPGGPGGPGVPGSNGTNGATLTGQSTPAGLASHGSSPQSVPVSVSPNRGALVGINATVTAPTAGCGGTGMQIDIYFDEQNAAHQLLSKQFPSGAPATVLTANAYVAKQATTSNHNVIITLQDDCPNPGGNPPPSNTFGFANAKIDVVEFAPAP